jgi:DNA-binding CsgD family transcriptional regulator
MAGALLGDELPQRGLAQAVAGGVEQQRAVGRCIELTRKLRLDVLRGVVLGAGAMAVAQRGERDRMEQRLAEALEVSEGHPDVAAIATASRASYWAQRDDLPRLEAELDATMELLRLAPHYPLPARGLWALVRVFQDHDAAASLIELGESFPARHGIGRAYFDYATAIALGRAGDAVGAVQHVALADRLSTPLSWFQHHARRLVAEAALADGWGDPVTWLQEAMAEFEARGQDALVASCRRLLAKAGAPVARRSSAGEGVPEDLQVQGVTARELQVLELLAEATSTRDIATRLYLSPKTVERHVANLATKLGVSGRAALVALAAARPGWGPTG